MSKITVLGAGAWGTTLAILLAQNGNEVSIWSFEKELVSKFQKFRENKKYLPGFPLPVKIDITDDLDCLKNSETVVIAVPTQHIRSVLKEAGKLIKDNTQVLSASKGIEISTLKRPTEIIAEFTTNLTAAISGPNLAKEIARGLPAASVIGTYNLSLSQNLQLLFKDCKNFRVYTCDDPIGVELGGALKNIIAIAAGAIDGKKLGDNAKAALIIRGISEIKRLGIAMGAKAETFYGLSGLGDLVTTCQSPMSRNHIVGERLANGEKLNDILGSMNAVAEGITTAKAAIKLKEKYNIEMPITQEIYNVLFENKSVDLALMALMSRPLKSES
ncbi:NAD(P)-dependent glycerol-3-phosphate dehydrogenase [Candidatus Saganbacteria bacterium]|nr:NAD(P)-dependent glycerol-3-phosphate dehydrogenase [Candidatus Saganbacteria bacterium]